MRLRVIALLVVGASVAVTGCAYAQKAKWEPIGLSGGGGMFAPAVSPANPKIMMINCDMSGAYISQDGGRNWTMINQLQLRSNTRCRPGFSPIESHTVFAANGWNGLCVSRDTGVTWQPTGKGLPGNLQGEIAIAPGNVNHMLAGAENAVWRSADAGKTWSRCDGPTGEPLSFHSEHDGARCYAGTTEGVWRSDDGGATWSRKVTGLPERPIYAFAGGTGAGRTILYCTIESKAVDGKFTGGVYRSVDRGDSWQPCGTTGLNTETKPFDEWAMGPIAQYRELVTTDANPRIVYTFCSSTGVPPPHDATLYKSEDGGETWRSVFQADLRYPNCNVELDYTEVEDHQNYGDVARPAICSTNPNVIVMVDNGRCYVTQNGGQSWYNGFTRRVPGSESPARWICNGLVVTTTWNYYIDPFEPNRHYICYTDIGFARSTDAGKTWSWWQRNGRPPWQNTCYQLAFDPQTPGKIWGAFSNVHDIPNDNIISGRHGSKGPGGVCVSTDFATTWKVSNQGLPVGPTTSVVVDPRSPKGNRTLYAGLFGFGVYKSTDDGKTWTAKNDGLGTDENRRVTRVYLHPDGTLFASITAFRKDGRFQQDGVGLYRSKDGGDHWTWINRSNPLLWTKDFTVDPNDSRIVYLSAARAYGTPGGEDQAGLYRTTDGGATWKRLAQKGPEHFGAYLNPKRPGWIYMTLTESAPGAGLWLSQDNGATWKPINGLPFANAMRVAFDPADPDVIYVTTFGGSVWCGPTDE